ncbi:adenylyl cyclase-associated protein 1 isoform X2 [Eupeodes corollae]|nr:adenylyl cyclase-associated protein 1 isoform X2 [Eupeodes corollae]
MDPPVTPVGRDELELRRHRIYSDLITAAQAAVGNRVRFNPLGPDIASEECDPDFRPSIAADLESLLNRLEHLVERLERSVSARELQIANQTFDSVLEKKRASFDLESTELPPIPNPDSEGNEQQEKSQQQNLNARIERIESSLNKFNDSFSKDNENDIDGSLENIPTTVLEEFLPDDNQESPLPPPPPPISESMSVLGYQDIVQGPLSQYLALSQKIGGDVATHSKLVKAAFDAQTQYVMLATESAKPSQDKQMELLKPTSDQISAIQSFREKNRASPFFNHLSAISESIPALGWVCVSPTPGPHVKEMNDAGQFYTNRVLKDWKEKDPTHVEWARAWIQTLTDLQQYIKQYHTTGLVWSGKGAPAGVPPPPPSMAGCPPPPPPPAFDLAAMSLDKSADERNELFKQINQGEDITKSLKKVTADMQTHKNPTLRTGPAPFKAPTQQGDKPAVPPKAVIKDPVFARDGKKWIIEHQRSNPNLLVENAEMNNVVYVFKCENSTLTIKGKVNNVVFDSCKKCSLLFDSVVSSVEFVNCQSVQMQVLGSVPTVTIDKTDGCQMYLSKESLGVAIISSKSSEMNVSIPMANGDFMEQALPEQFRTTIQGNTLQTVCVDSLG